MNINNKSLATIDIPEDTPENSGIALISLSKGGEVTVRARNQQINGDIVVDSESTAEIILQEGSNIANRQVLAYNVICW